MSRYAKEERGCWHEVVATTRTSWTAVCGRVGRAYTHQPMSVTELAGPPSPLCCCIAEVAAGGAPELHGSSGERGERRGRMAANRVQQEREDA
jgi:hypothetical protein